MRGITITSIFFVLDAILHYFFIFVKLFFNFFYFTYFDEFFLLDKQYLNNKKSAQNDAFLNIQQKRFRIDKLSVFIPTIVFTIPTIRSVFIA